MPPSLNSLFGLLGEVYRAKLGALEAVQMRELFSALVPAPSKLRMTEPIDWNVGRYGYGILEMPKFPILLHDEFLFDVGAQRAEAPPTMKKTYHVIACPPDSHVTGYTTASTTVISNGQSFELPVRDYEAEKLLEARAALKAARAAKDAATTALTAVQHALTAANAEAERCRLQRNDVSRGYDSAAVAVSRAESDFLALAAK